jgi:hypothetical protein
LDKAKIEAHQTISIIESQLKCLDKAECLHNNEKITRKHLTCTPDMDRKTLVRIAEEELMYLQKLSSKEKSIEVCIKLSTRRKKKRIRFFPLIFESKIH